MWSVMPKARQNIKALEAAVCQFSVLIKPKQEAQWNSSNKAEIPPMISTFYLNKINKTGIYIKSSDANASKYVWHFSLKLAFLSGYYV